jgi:hypothetical protein
MLQPENCAELVVVIVVPPRFVHVSVPLAPFVPAAVSFIEVDGAELRTFPPASTIETTGWVAKAVRLVLPDEGGVENANPTAGPVWTVNGLLVVVMTCPDTAEESVATSSY